ncbi:hypothetical protein [Oricola sp.]|uniref:hypothetical protein n=1 Tax=Oricola sp. TaxID=1979950 RepID=UPI0025F5EBDF|nr:hypothetical protein [Oricola sp.]MCI5074227.1 hypothetical protein [Oricola sp.]
MSEKAINDQTSMSSAALPEGRVLLVGALMTALIGLIGFAGWVLHGDTLFWSLLQAGLAWCG